MELINVRKRNGEIVPYERDKIAKAIEKAFIATGTEANEALEASKYIASEIEYKMLEREDHTTPTVEFIQDMVEETLMERGFTQTAKAYILYRDKRRFIRENTKTIDERLREILGTASFDSDLKRDNANVDGNSAMGTMLQIGANASKNYYSRNYLTNEERVAFESGDIHIHDFDFYAGLTETCCQIDFKALAERGFSTGHGYIRPPQSIRSYAALACIAIQANQNDQHGGQSIPNFDYAMAEGVKKTYIKEFKNRFAAYYEDELANLKPGEGKRIISEIIDNMKVKPTMKDHDKFDSEFTTTVKTSIPTEKGKYSPALLTIRGFVGKAHKRAYNATERATYQAMESVIYNLCSMQSRAGAQVPFSSLNYGTDTSPEGRMVMHQILLATKAGLGNGETPIFPIQIFKVKEGVNYNPEDPNYDLFKLSMRVSAKRLFPNYVFLDAPFNLQYYVPGHPETEVATMGVRLVPLQV